MGEKIDKKGIDFEKILPLLGVIVGGIIAISGVIMQNELSKESIESELVIVDMHLEEKEYFQIKDQFPGNLSITRDDGKEISNFSFLEVNITVVNSVYSKYPAKIRDSKIDLIGGNKKTSDNVLEYGSENIKYTSSLGETTTIIGLLSHKPINPSEYSTITQYVLVPFEGDYNLTGFFEIWYYDPMIEEIKNIGDEVFILRIKGGKIEKITPLKYYVTIKGYKMEDYEFAVYK